MLNVAAYVAPLLASIRVFLEFMAFDLAICVLTPFQQECACLVFRTVPASEASTRRVLEASCESS